MTPVEVWMVPVPAGAHRDEAVLAALGQEQRAHLADLGMPADRDRAAVARAAARHVLGARLHVSPADVPLKSRGQPQVMGTPWSVSWSHSGRWVALALGTDRAVGVDIEAVPEPERPPRWERALQALGMAHLEEFVALEAASKVTGCRHAGRWPPGVTVRRLCAPGGYLAAVAAVGDGWALEVHLSPTEVCAAPHAER